MAALKPVQRDEASAAWMVTAKQIISGRLKNAVDFFVYFFKWMGLILFLKKRISFCLQ